MTTQLSKVDARRVLTPEIAPDIPRPAERHDDEIMQEIGYAPGRRHRVAIRYSLWGPAGAPLVIALGGISAHRRCDRWWGGVFGPDRALDPHRYRVLSMDWLDRFWPDGRPVSTAQQATALASVLNHLGIATAHSIIGASYGAMAGLAFAARFPERIGRLLAISGAHAPHPMAVAQRLIQRRIVELGMRTGHGDEALEIARALALTTYRPDTLFARRFGSDDSQVVLDKLSNYFDLQGQRFRSGFDPSRYLCLSESLDRHRLDPSAIRCPVELVAVDSDTLVPPGQLRGLASALGRRGRYREIRSDFGHDAFLKEHETFNPLIRHAIEGESS